jgi:Ni,Fe-hydrogenase III small subunit
METALHEAIDSDPEARVVVEVKGDAVGGFVLSDAFAQWSTVERQDHVRAYVDRVLTPSEGARVMFVIADTHAEYAALTN